MPNCAVIDIATNEQINWIVAEPTDLAPDGCRLVEIPDGYFWDGQSVSPIPVEVINGG
jgi:hypothetical protein